MTFFVDDYYRNMLIFFPGLIVNVFGLPFLFVCHIALFSKLLSNDIQGMINFWVDFDILALFFPRVILYNFFLYLLIYGGLGFWG